MFNYLKYQIKKLMNILEDFKGTKVVRYNCTYKTEDSNYRIVTNNDFEVVIYCAENVYTCEYSNPLFRPKELSVYHIYSVCSEHTPIFLKVKLTNELKIPSLTSFGTSREYKKKAAIQAYVDLVIHELHKYNATIKT